MHIKRVNLDVEFATSVTAPLPPSPAMRRDPRAQMAEALPGWIQPFLTWLTAKPAPDETAALRPPLAFVIEALALTLGGCAVTALAMTLPGAGGPVRWLAVALGLLATCSGLGLFQVVIFHHCSHGTVFATRARNRLVGRAVSAVLLFKHFDAYQREHMLHHSPHKLFTDEDEFTDFVVGICELRTAWTRQALWRRLITLLLSPRFHLRFLIKRVQGALMSPDRAHNLVGIAVWSALFAGAAASHMLTVLLVAWILPVTVLLQVATVFRILCEHRLPPPETLAVRGRQLVCEATAGVFPGVAPPRQPARTARGLLAWTLWWLDMLIVQLFVRLFVLVGDAPCHDFHHRRPGKRWTSYVHGRQEDEDKGSPGFPVNYIETWGMFRAVDQNFAAMARAPVDMFG